MIHRANLLIGLNRSAGDEARLIVHTAPNTNPLSAEYRLIAAWRATLRGFFAASKRILMLHGVTSMQYQALLAIHIADEPDGLTITGLAQELGIRHNSAVGLINRMVTHGDVKRVRSHLDRRVAHLRITPVGESTLHKLVEAHRVELRQIGPEVKRIFSNV
jgi:DNA-binding MarR family transcriptional regulator